MTEGTAIQPGLLQVSEPASNPPSLKEALSNRVLLKKEKTELKEILANQTLFKIKLPLIYYLGLKNTDKLHIVAVTYHESACLSHVQEAWKGGSLTVS